MITYYVKFVALSLLIAAERSDAVFGKKSSNRHKLLDDFVESMQRGDVYEAGKHLKILDQGALTSKTYTADLQYPLLIAIEKKAHDFVKIMTVEKNVDPCVVDANRNNIFHYAAYYADAEMVRILQWTMPETKKLANRKNAEGFRPLMIAVCTEEHNRTISQQCAIVRALISAGANVNATNPGLDSVLHVVPHADVAKLLLAEGAKVNALNEANCTPIMSAIASQKRDVVRLLLTREDVDVTIPDKHGYTPFHIIRVVWKEDIVKSLLAKGAPIDAMDEKGNTPLVKHFLYDIDYGKAWMKNPEIRKGLIYDYLIEAGARLDVPNKDGQSFSSLVRQHKIEELNRKGY